MNPIHEILEKVPKWEKYYTVDELHESSAKLVNDYPKKVDLIDLGKSTNGEIIDCLKIGKGKYNALIHGFPNCEEPFGGNLLTYFSWALCEFDDFREELDYTWYLIKCSDPDGARLNEGFQEGPHTPMNFSLNYYRTPNIITPDSCFPFRFGALDLNNPVPETEALMKILNKVPMNFVSSLHMMKWGGITYEVPHACPQLYAFLWNVAKQFNIFPRKRLGTTLAPGIQHAAYLTPAKGWLKQWANKNKNIEPIPGCNFYEYAEILNPYVFTMIPECCIWYDPRMWDDSPSDTTLGEAIKYANERADEVSNFMLDTWNTSLPYLKTRSPFKFMMDKWMEPIIRKYTNVSNPPFTFNQKTHARKATIAEKIGVEGREDIYRMFYLGGLIRTLEHEMNKSGNNELEEQKSRAHHKLKEYDEFLHANYKVVAHPIRNLVGMSLGSLLYSAEYAKSRSP
jgi:hypothetical protein